MVDFKKHAWWIAGLIVFLVIIYALWRYRATITDKIKSGVAWLKGIIKGGGTTGGGSTPPPSGCTFPVTVNSNPSCILSAFNKSGYEAELQSSIDSGKYPPEYMTIMKSDPVAWLRNHPFMFSAYPDWFKAV